jgi:hypothetical protein
LKLRSPLQSSPSLATLAGEGALYGRCGRWSGVVRQHARYEDGRQHGCATKRWASPSGYHVFANFSRNHAEQSRARDLHHLHGQQRHVVHRPCVGLHHSSTTCGPGTSRCLRVARIGNVRSLRASARRRAAPCQGSWPRGSRRCRGGVDRRRPAARSVRRTRHRGPSPRQDWQTSSASGVLVRPEDHDRRVARRSVAELGPDSRSSTP